MPLNGTKGSEKAKYGLILQFYYLELHKVYQLIVLVGNRKFDYSYIT